MNNHLKKSGPIIYGLLAVQKIRDLVLRYLQSKWNTL